MITQEEYSLMEKLRQANVVYESVVRKEKDLGQYASNEIALVEFIMAGIEYGKKHNIWEIEQFAKELYRESKLKSEQIWLINEVINNFKNQKDKKLICGCNLTPLDELKKDGLK